MFVILCVKKMVVILYVGSLTWMCSILKGWEMSDLILFKGQCFSLDCPSIMMTHSFPLRWYFVFFENHIQLRRVWTRYSWFIQFPCQIISSSLSQSCQEKLVWNFLWRVRSHNCWWQITKYIHMCVNELLPHHIPNSDESYVYSPTKL